jgi:hypothetical protein
MLHDRSECSSRSLDEMASGTPYEASNAIPTPPSVDVGSGTDKSPATTTDIHLVGSDDAWVRHPRVRNSGSLTTILTLVQ